MSTFGLDRPLRGIVPPLVTPLHRNRLDVAALERLIEHLLAEGVHGLFILGTTGEGPSLGAAIRRDIVRHTCRQVARRVPVLVGITDTAMGEAAAMRRFAAECGADAVVASTPYYFKPSQDELAACIERLVADDGLPLFLYNIPQMTGVAFAPATVARLMRHERIVGIKDSGGDLAYFAELLRLAPARADWSVLMGNEHLLAQAILLGAHGGVPGSANALPHAFVALYEAAMNGDTATVKAMHDEIIAFGRIYDVGSGASAGIAALKYACQTMALCNAEPAPPLRPLDPAQQAQVRALLPSRHRGHTDHGERQSVASR